MQHQHTFDIVVRALVKQGTPSGVRVNDGGFECRYLDPNGNRCAAGHLGNGFTEYVTINAAENRAIVEHEGHDVCLVAKLQSDHDEAAVETDGSAEWMSKWAEYTRATAKRNSLSTAALDEALAARATKA